MIFIFAGIFALITTFTIYKIANTKNRKQQFEKSKFYSKKNLGSLNTENEEFPKTER